MRLIGIGLLIACACIAFAQTAEAQNASYIDACAASLKMNEVNQNSDEILEYALLTYIVQSSKDEQDFRSKFGGITPYGYFDGTLDGAKSRAEFLDKRLNLHWNKRLSTAYAMKYLSPEGASAFSKCVQDVFKSDGMHVAIQETDESTISVSITYRPGPIGDRSPDFKLAFLSDGDFASGQNLQLPVNGVVDRQFAFTKPNPSKNLHLQIDVTSHGVSLASQVLFIPPKITETLNVVSRSVKSEESVATCSGNGDWHYTHGKNVAIHASGAFDMQSLVPTATTSATGPEGCGPNTVMSIIQPKMNLYSASQITTIIGRAECEPGPHKEHFCTVSGTIEAIDKVTTVVVGYPADTKVNRPFRKM